VHHCDFIISYEVRSSGARPVAARKSIHLDDLHRLLHFLLHGIDDLVQCSLFRFFDLVFRPEKPLLFAACWQ